MYIIKYFRYDIPQWQPLSKSISVNSLPPVLLSSRTISSAIDAFFTIFLAYHIVEKSNDKQRALQCLYLESLEVVAIIELTGIEFCRLRCSKLIANISVQLLDIEKRVYCLCGGVKFNLDSPEEVSKVSFLNFILLIFISANMLKICKYKT